MKKLVFCLAVLGSIFTGCSSDNENETPVKQPVVGEISANITANTTYAYGNYTLKGMIKVSEGVTLTFEAGSTITCDKSTGQNGLVILKGGKLIANGTADAPIVFTEKSKVGGAWAGIIIYGDAPIVNSATAPAPQTAVSEDGLGLTYGGLNATHSSG